MSGDRRSTLRAQWLGKHLRDLRDAAGLKLQEAAEHIQRTSSTVSRMELGTVPVRTPDVLELLNLYGVADPILRAGLEDLSREVWRKGWWDGYKQHLAVQIIDLAWLESRTARLRDFSTLVLPGLLQTPGYAEAIMRAADPDTPEERVESRIEFRMRRQEVLTREEPLPYTSILDEATMHRAVGGPKTMRAQLQHLLDMSHHSNVTIRMLPFATGAPASPEGAFALFTMAEPFPDVAQINTEGGAIYLEMPEAERFDEAYTRLEREALGVEDSRAFIKSRMEQLE